ncbi:hypothetical protein K525DRAFT_237829 [Schizophyllum commune Loenen D]|nr:hypothetical protein K525DRAFT_237829 [Schizophyllum commune Loenen D]
MKALWVDCMDGFTARATCTWQNRRLLYANRRRSLTRSLRIFASRRAVRQRGRRVDVGGTTMLSASVNLQLQALLMYLSKLQSIDTSSLMHRFRVRQSP